MKFLEILKEVSPYTNMMTLWKLQKSDMLLLNYIEHLHLSLLMFATKW